jgi:hypothetical protein
MINQGRTTKEGVDPISTVVILVSFVRLILWHPQCMGVCDCARLARCVARRDATLVEAGHLYLANFTMDAASSINLTL